MVFLTIWGIQKVSFIDNTLSVITDVNSVKQQYAINYRGSVHDRAIAIRDVVIGRNASKSPVSSERLMNSPFSTRIQNAGCRRCCDLMRNLPVRNGKSSMNLMVSRSEPYP